MGKTIEACDEEYGGRGWILQLSPKGRSVKLDRQANAMALVGDAMTGLRRDNDLLQAARFEVLISSWELKPPRALTEAGEEPEFPTWWSDDPTMDAYDGLPPNLADSIAGEIDRYLRPRAFENPAFFTPKSPASSPSSSETSPLT
jgi:hypothetical protein